MSDFAWLLKVAGLAWVGCSICVGRTVDNAPRPKGLEGGVNGLEPMAGFQVVMARQAAEKGDPRAQFTLGWCHATGQGAPRDDAQAAAW
nr:sel1 repeat family protein [Geothrix sp.]